MVTTKKYFSPCLGVFVDNNLTWNEHIKHISRKIASNIWLLSKMKVYLSQEHPIKFYKSYIRCSDITAMDISA